MVMVARTPAALASRAISNQAATDSSVPTP